jgi:hypothetical protein
MQLNPHQPKCTSSNLEPGLPLLIGTSTGGRSIVRYLLRGRFFMPFTPSVYGRRLDDSCNGAGRMLRVSQTICYRFFALDCPLAYINSTPRADFFEVASRRPSRHLVQRLETKKRSPRTRDQATAQSHSPKSPQAPSPQITTQPVGTSPTLSQNPSAASASESLGHS